MRQQGKSLAGAAYAITQAAMGETVRVPISSETYRAFAVRRLRDAAELLGQPIEFDAADEWATVGAGRIRVSAPKDDNA